MTDSENIMPPPAHPGRRSASLTCDVLVVGAGPAGSRAAEAAASAGAQVILVEKKKRVGSLPHCAEFVPRLLGLEVDIPDRARVQGVEGMETRLMGNEPVFTPGPGWILDRQVFDHHLAVQAVSAGAEIWAGSALKGREDGRWLISRGGQGVEVLAGAVIAADGGFSRAARIAGWPGQDLMPGVQYQVPLAQPLTRTQVFLEPRFLGGYAWLFPKGEVANLGLGCRVQAKPWRLLEELRQELLERVVIRPGILSLSAGAIPVGGVREELIRDEVILCGDAAGLTHPVTGAGIPQAVFSGRQAGEAALALLQEAGKGEHGYGDELAMRYGRNLSRGAQARSLWEDQWQGDDFRALMADTWPAWGEKA
jgi:digeranylgeranylglycerophospholipid reductase